MIPPASYNSVDKLTLPITRPETAKHTCNTHLMMQTQWWHALI